MNLTVSQRYGFFSVLATIIRESSDKQLVLGIVKALPFINQPDRVAPKASDVQQLIGYINTCSLCDKIKYSIVTPRLHQQRGISSAHAPIKFVRRVRHRFDILSALPRVFNWAIDSFLQYFLERDGRV